MTAEPQPSVAVAYLVSQYPALSHTFIETEVEHLRLLGARVDTFSVRRCPDEELLTVRARAEAATTTVLKARAGRLLLRALCHLLRRSPEALFSTLGTALRTGPGTARGRLWQLFYLAEAVLLWWHMRGRGLRRVHVHFANNGADVARLAVALGNALDGAGGGWSWSLTMHGPTEFEDRSAFDLAAKIRSASAVACISDFCRSQVMRLVSPDDWQKLAVVRMAVDTRRFQPPEMERRSADDQPLRILTVGRLVPEKGAPLLIDAISILRARGVRAEVTIVGAGPLAPALVARAEQRGVAESVHVVGPVGQDDLPALYAEADVFCLPSFAEGLPVVLMEAMAAELPVVTTAIAGIPELVADRLTGRLVTPGRADLLAAALADLVSDPGLASAMGRAGRQVVLANHDPESNARRLVALLAESEVSRP